MSIVDSLIHLFPEYIYGTPGALDLEGTWVASGPVVAVRARFEGQVRMVRTRNGQEVMSSLTAIVAGTPGFTPETYRFTIPSRYTPHTDLTAVAVSYESDENGPIYEEVALP